MTDSEISAGDKKQPVLTEELWNNGYGAKVLADWRSEFHRLILFGCDLNKKEKKKRKIIEKELQAPKVITINHSLDECIICHEEFGKSSNVENIACGHNIHPHCYVMMDRHD